MEKKRAMMVNVLVIAAILLLSLVLLIVSKIVPRRVTPDAGPLEMEFEPAVTTETSSVWEGWSLPDVFEEDVC